MAEGSGPGWAQEEEDAPIVNVGIGFVRLVKELLRTPSVSVIPLEEHGRYQISTRERGYDSVIFEVCTDYEIKVIRYRRPQSGGLRELLARVDCVMQTASEAAA